MQIPFDPQFYLAAIVESSDDAIISKDLNGFITSWNKSAERIFGYTSSEVVGRHITLIIPAERLAEEENILLTLKTGERIDHFETVRRHKDGHLVPVSLTVSPIRDGEGNIMGASKISRDISDWIKAEKLISDMSQKKDDFLANMSHELRTPMNAVIGLANLLQSSQALSERDRKYVDTLKISADSLMELINDLLDFAKIDSQTLELEKIEFNLAEQVHKAVSVMKVKAQEKNIRLNVTYPQNLREYYKGDPLRIHQILTNLLSNAVKFTDAGSVEMTIESLPRQDDSHAQVIIRVADTGIGIAKDKLGTIFEKFVQADSSISRRYGGSGLGLAITRALVEKMHGTIDVESAPGIGTTFTVSLPLACSAQEIHIDLTGGKTFPHAQSEKKNILLVEDYDANILVATAMLEDLGYSVDVARTGIEAIRAFLQIRYDVILMDVQLHELDGLSATRKIRQIEAERSLPRTPIIAMTAHVKEQDKEECLEAGMDDFIPKPFEPRNLAEKISHYAKNPADLSEKPRACS